MTLIAADLANLYPAHLASLQQHYLDAAMLAGAAGVVIAAGALQPCFLDDSHYPFVVNPNFKAYIALIPGSKGRVQHISLPSFPPPISS